MEDIEDANNTVNKRPQIVFDDVPSVTNNDVQIIERKYQCSKCHFRFYSELLLREHERLHEEHLECDSNLYNGGSNASKSIMPPITSYKCGQCNCVCPSWDILKKHQMSHEKPRRKPKRRRVPHPRLPYKMGREIFCAECHLSFPSVPSLRKHYRKAHFMIAPKRIKYKRQKASSNRNTQQERPSSDRVDSNTSSHDDCHNEPITSAHNVHNDEPTTSSYNVHNDEPNTSSYNVHHDEPTTSSHNVHNDEPNTSSHNVHNDERNTSSHYIHDDDDSNTSFYVINDEDSNELRNQHENGIEDTIKIEPFEYASHEFEPLLIPSVLVESVENHESIIPNVLDSE